MSFSVRLHFPQISLSLYCSFHIYIYAHNPPVPGLLSCEFVSCDRRGQFSVIFRKRWALFLPLYQCHHHILLAYIYVFGKFFFFFPHPFWLLNFCQFLINFLLWPLLFWSPSFTSWQPSSSHFASFYFSPLFLSFIIYISVLLHLLVCLRFLCLLLNIFIFYYDCYYLFSP